ncbi:MAG: hypothetical protein DI556_13220 [Rhodovulum sulfidophilum]|uniref:YecA family protein n=1 Tax=Rhodovulum sulfidophilum TaxID=35806 RepID=A0A2W5Q211_RHOSU|nr:MAG: hypothetical protein DI556_13220 [Rhodovulum sulfidophilum]
MTFALSTLIAAIADTTDEGAYARLVRDGGLALLADAAAVADVADAVACPEDDAATRAAMALLSQALDEARMALENDAPEGEALITAVAEVLAARDAARPFTPAARLRLAQVYARAGLVPPPFAILASETMAGSEVAREMPDLGALLEPILKEVGDAPLQVHAALDELFAGIPSELAAMLVSMTIARPGALEPRLGLYWLLDPRPEVRLAAAVALLTRAEVGTLAPDLAALLPALRKLLPDDPARAALDAAIRRRMCDGGPRAEVPAVTIHRAAASLPDGAGAQSLVAAIQRGGRRGVAMAMLKQGHGVKDAFVIPCNSASEQRRVLARVLNEIETFDLPPVALAEALARGLGEGLALDLLPAPGLVDLAEIWGPDALAPAAGDTGAILAAIGGSDALEALPAARRAALVKESIDWMDCFGQIDSWFEDTAALRAAIARARTDKGRETAVWAHLETRRDWWARHFAVSAAVLRSAPEPTPWLSFAAVAQALLDERSLRRIPIMVDIVDQTLEAFEARNSGAPSREAGAPIGTLLAGAGIGEAYLRGYLAALSIAPLAPSPGAWLGPLLGGIEFPGEGVLDRLLEYVMQDANRVDDEAGDPANVARWLAPLGADGLRDWVAGFDALVAATRRCWPTKSLNADDKRVLRDVALVAKGSDGGALRAVLPAWVARRHASRR